MALKGKSVVVEASDDNTAWNVVAELNDSSTTLDGDNIEVSVFGEAWVKRIQGLKDGDWSFGGFYAPDDTVGQMMVQSAFINDTPIYLRVLFDGDNGFSQEVKVASFEVTAGVDGAVELSLDAEGNGDVSVVSL